MGRRYGGVTHEQRVQMRREALMSSALENFGTAGYAATSVKQICVTAALTERYFYEAFDDREDCLAALYDDLSGQMREDTLAAVAAVTEPGVAAVTGAGLSAFIGYLTADPRRARIVLIEVVGVSPKMEARRSAVLSDFADIVRAIWSLAEGGRELGPIEQSTAVLLVGAVNHLLVDWLQTGQVQTVEHLLQACATLFEAAAEKLDIETR